jgi:beta-glucanase (GH16 family)
MPGAGKSTVGVLLAKLTGLAFNDTDLAIQVAAGATLQEIVDSRGHLALRAIVWQMVSTRAGSIEIRTTNTGFRAAMYASASVQSWNKVCVQGGIVEVTVSLPGRAGRPGVWPAVWMLGNLGRATYPLSTDGLWPFSYSDCDADSQPVRVQRPARTTC